MHAQILAECICVQNPPPAPAFINGHAQARVVARTGRYSPADSLRRGVLALPELVGEQFPIVIKIQHAAGWHPGKDRMCFGPLVLRIITTRVEWVCGRALVLERNISSRVLAVGEYFGLQEEHLRSVFDKFHKCIKCRLAAWRWHSARR